MPTFGLRLRKARTQRNLSQEAVAAELGVSKSQVSAWENENERVPSKHLAKLSRMLRLSLDKLFFGDELDHIREGSPGYLEPIAPVNPSDFLRVLNSLSDKDRRLIAAMALRLSGGG